MAKSLTYENPTDYQQQYTQPQLQQALAQSGLSQQDQDTVLKNYNGIVNGGGPAPGGSSTTSAVNNPKWVYAVNMPSTYPDFKAMKEAGAGLIVSSDDPNAAALVAAARQWGVSVGVQVNAPIGITPEEYASRVAQAQTWAPEKLVLDIEVVGKGYEGSEGWKWSQQTATLLGDVVGGTSVAITMEPHQDDYNYGAYKHLGGGPTEFWVQTYTGDMTDVDQTWATSSARSAGVKVIPITSPKVANSDGNYVSYGIPQTGATSAGQYGTTSTGPSKVPPNTTPGTGPGVPGEIPETGPTGPGSPTPPTTTPPTTGTDTPAADDWASVYFGSFGLPSDVAKKVNDIFKKYPETDQAVQFALAYIRGTPWYKQTFPGIEYGIQHGIISNELDYRQYVTSLDTLSMRYYNRHISGTEITNYLLSGLSPDVVARQYQGAAFAAANGQDVNYFLGAFSDAGLQSVSNLTALGNQQAGLDNPLGQKLTRALSQAMTTYSKLFEGRSPTPSLSLGSGGLNAPSLLGGKASPDVGA